MVNTIAEWTSLGNSLNLSVLYRCSLRSSRSRQHRTPCCSLEYMHEEWRCCKNRQTIKQIGLQNGDDAKEGIFINACIFPSCIPVCNMHSHVQSNAQMYYTNTGSGEVNSMKRYDHDDDDQDRSTPRSIITEDPYEMYMYSLYKMNMKFVPVR